VVNIRILLFLKEIKFCLKKVSSTIGGKIITENRNKISFNQLSALNKIIPLLRLGNIFSNLGYFLTCAIFYKLKG